jgi:hypothetical protein
MIPDIKVLCKYKLLQKYDAVLYCFYFFKPKLMTVFVCVHTVRITHILITVRITHILIMFNLGTSSLSPF